MSRLFQGFVGKGGDAALQQQLGEGAVGGEVQVGEEELPRPQQLVFGGKRLLDLDQQLAAAKEFTRSTSAAPARL